MSPYKVFFSDGGTSCALLDISFETNHVTSQEVEQVLRAEIEKHKGRTKRPIRAEAFLEGVDYEIQPLPFGLQLPDGSHSITYYHDVAKALTGSQASGGHDNLTGETADYFYRTETIQTYGPDGFSEWINVKVVLKRTQFSNMKEFFGMLYFIVVELSELEKDLSFSILSGDPKNPVSWRPVSADGKRFDFDYNAKTRTIRNGKTILANVPMPGAQAQPGKPKKAPAKRKRKKE